ncbi:MAG: serine/threonine-protein kinase [Gemmatimonadetes bacterium]|nr:serine/threonine-protein kinase [Gemmatimonadota bacterium]
MPLVEGESLRDRLEREKQLPVDEAVEIGRAVASALEYAHQRGIIHRDIKPGNILLQSGQPLVADFGIALALQAAEGTRLTQTGISLGTPHYMSPEQATGDRELDPRSDVYALGAILYESLTGSPPFGGSSTQSIVAKILTAEPEDISATRGTVPDNVTAAIQKALSKLPADRFSTAADFSRALANPSFTTATGRLGAQAAFVGAEWRRRTLVSGGLAAGLGLLAIWGWLRPVPQPTPSIHRVQLWADPPTTRQVSQEMILSPDGSAIAFVDTIQGQRRLLVKERDRLDPSPVSDAVDPGGLFFSPDGEWIGFWQDGALKKVPRGGGAAVTFADSVQRIEPAGAWLDDGSVVFAREGRLYRVDADGGEAHPVSEASIPGLWYLAPLPGGRGVLFSSCEGSCHRSRVYVLDLESGALHSLLEDAILGAYVPTGHILHVQPDGRAYAAPFDLDELRLTAPSVEVLDGVALVGVSASLVVSQSGSVLYLEGPQLAPSGLSEPVWLDREGNATPIDQGWTLAAAQESGLALSSDGRLLAAALEADGKVDVWVKELPDGSFVRLTFADSVSYRPSWTEDGRTVMYVDHSGDRCRLMARRADGSTPARLILDDHDACMGQWSRDGDWLVFRADRADGSGDILGLREGEGETPAALVATEFHETSPELSPDGRWLAYASDESGRSEVYLRPFPAVDEARWLVSDAGGAMPFWDSGGRELFFIDGEGVLVASALDFGPPLRTRNRPLFSMAVVYAGVSNDRAGVRMFGVTPDGTRFFALRGAGSERIDDRVAIVLRDGWIQDLEDVPGS